MPPDTPIRVLIADDHGLFRAGLAELLSMNDAIEVVGQAASGPETLTSAAQLKPHVVLLDVSMPGPGPTRIIQRLTDARSASRVIVLTMHDDPKLVAETIEAGARGYLVKSAQHDELISALHLVVRSNDEVIVQVSRATMLAIARRQSQTPMSSREAQVLDGLHHAKTTQQISDELHISQATVKRHLTNLYSKLGANSRAEAVRKARALGLLDPSVTDDS